MSLDNFTHAELVAVLNGARIGLALAGKYGREGDGPASDRQLERKIGQVIGEMERRRKRTMDGWCVVKGCGENEKTKGVGMCLKHSIFWKKGHLLELGSPLPPNSPLRKEPVDDRNQSTKDEERRGKSEGRGARGEERNGEEKAKTNHEEHQGHQEHKERKELPMNESKKCLAPGCTRPQTSRGLCEACNFQFRNNPDTDRGRAIAAVILPSTRGVKRANVARSPSAVTGTGKTQPGAAVPHACATPGCTRKGGHSGWHNGQGRAALARFQNRIASPPIREGRLQRAAAMRDTPAEEPRRTHDIAESLFKQVLAALGVEGVVAWQAGDHLQLLNVASGCMADIDAAGKVTAMRMEVTPVEQQ